MLALLLAVFANAGGHYTPADTAARSALYNRAAESAGSTFRDAQARVEAVGNALDDYQTGLDLLGDSATADDIARLQALKKRFARERAVLQAFATTMMEDFDTEFQAALTRALPADAVQCQARVPTGPALPGMPAPMEDNPDCTGDDLNPTLGAALDADPALNASIDEILGLEWPAISLDQTPRSAVGDAEQWVAITPWFGAAAGNALKAIDRRDAEARLPFEAAIEQGADKEALQAMLADARKVTEDTRQRRAAVAAPVLDAVAAWSAKRVKKGRAGVAWCANPALLGGCTGTDVTASKGAELRADKKIAKALP